MPNSRLARARKTLPDGYVYEPPQRRCVECGTSLGFIETFHFTDGGTAYEPLCHECYSGFVIADTLKAAHGYGAGV